MLKIEVSDFVHGICGDDEATHDEEKEHIEEEGSREKEKILLVFDPAAAKEIDFFACSASKMTDKME